MKSLQRWIPLTGFTILTLMVITLLVATVITGLKSQITGGLLSIIVLVGAIIAIFIEGKRLITDKNIIDDIPIKTHILDFIAVFVGGVLTCLLSQDIGLGAVVAASLVAIAAHMVFPDLGVPAYCGAFVGMTSNALLFTRGEVALASAVAGMVYVLTSRVFTGFGGKLGTIALIGVAATGISLRRQFLFAPMFDNYATALIILVAVIATPLTFYLSCPKKNGPVLASGAVGLAAGLLLPVLSPELGSTLAVVAICASFGGMTSQERCSNMWIMLITGVFTGIVFVFSTPLLGGAGGKLGTIAFGSILATYGYIRLYRSFSGERTPSTNQCA